MASSSLIERIDQTACTRVFVSQNVCDIKAPQVRVSQHLSGPEITLCDPLECVEEMHEAGRVDKRACPAVQVCVRAHACLVRVHLLHVRLPVNLSVCKANVLSLFVRRYLDTDCAVQATARVTQACT